MIEDKFKEELKRLPSSLVTLVILLSFIISGFLMGHTLNDLVNNVQETKNDVKTLLINQASQNQALTEHERRLNLIDSQIKELKRK
jgi:hypothetical protein